MSENTAPAANASESTEPKELTAEEKKAIFDSLPKEFQAGVNELNKEIAEHNSNVATVQAAEKQDANLIKAEIFEQSEDKDIKRLYDKYNELLAAADKLKDQAYEQIEKKKLMPGELTPEALEALKVTITESTKSLRDKQNAFVQIEAFMPPVKGKLIPLLEEIKTRRGISSAKGSSSQEGVKRLRFKRITVNNVTEDEKGNKVYGMVGGNEKYTFTFAANYLKKQHKGISWSPKDLTDAYLASVPDADNLPDSHVFEMPYTFKNGEGVETTVSYQIKTER